MAVELAFPQDVREPIRTSGAKAWARAIALTSPIARHPQRLLIDLIEEYAQRTGTAPALLSDIECFTYAELAHHARRYARWALAQGLKKGDIVALGMANRPEYMAAWLGLSSVGVGVALLNTNLTGKLLAHAIDVVAPAQIIVDIPQAAALRGHDGLFGAPAIWVHGPCDGPFRRIDEDLAQYASDPLSPRERRSTSIDDPALFVYTSGTTGLPKAAIVTHGRLMQWTHWFAGMMGSRPDDRMYNCLPMYHSVGGVVAIGGVMVAGGSVVVRDRFSARRFWADVVNWDCTLVQYIGELCRYLLRNDPDPLEHQHRLRLCCGNGLRADIWNQFRDRFRIPQILEFYAATEGNVSFFNAEGRPGAVGRIPPLLAHRFPAALIEYDIDADAPRRTNEGFCVRCGPGEVGEAIGPLSRDTQNVGTRFDGYTSAEASQLKIVRDVFAPGDAWYRTGDLMRIDRDGYIYFVDRIGDTFRWKGENVSTAEVADILIAVPGVREAVVYGVAIPGSDGRAGMAALVADDTFDLRLLPGHLERLPEYARPIFVRLRDTVEVTSTFKYSKVNLSREGPDPSATTDRIYFADRSTGSFVPMTPTLFRDINSGRIAL